MSLSLVRKNQLLSLLAFAILVAFVLFIARYTVVYADDKTHSNDDGAHVKQAYENWIKQVTTAKGNAEAVLPLYADDAILLPTLSNEIYYNQKDADNYMGDYFKKFTSLNNLSAQTNKLITRSYGDIAINSGLYTFSYTDNDGQDGAAGNTIMVPARFTFVYKKQEDGSYKIVEHHSSMLPASLD